MRKKIIVWECENEAYFLFNGNRYVDYIEVQKNEFEETQKEKKEEKVKQCFNVYCLFDVFFLYT